MDELFTNNCMGNYGGYHKQHILNRTLLISGNKISEQNKTIINNSIKINEKCFVLYYNYNPSGGQIIKYYIFRKYYIIENSYGNGTCYDYIYKSHNICKYESLKILSICNGIDISGLVDEFEKQEYDSNKIVIDYKKLTEELDKKEMECKYLHDEINKLKIDNAQLVTNFKTFTNRIYELETIIKEHF